MVVSATEQVTDMLKARRESGVIVIVGHSQGNVECCDSDFDFFSELFIHSFSYMVNDKLLQQ